MQFSNDPNAKGKGKAAAEEPKKAADSEGKGKGKAQPEEVPKVRSTLAPAFSRSSLAEPWEIQPAVTRTVFRIGPACEQRAEP